MELLISASYMYTPDQDHSTYMVAPLSLSSSYKVLRTFLHLQLHHVDEPVGAVGSNTRGRSRGRGKEDGRKEGRLSVAKLNKKQRKVRQCIGLCLHALPSITAYMLQHT